eukprot:487248-Rhodomonas_salina.1
MVGRPVLRYEEKINGKQLKDIMVGEDASELRSMLQISYPVDKGTPPPDPLQRVCWRALSRCCSFRTVSKRRLASDAVAGAQSLPDANTECTFVRGGEWREE